MSAAARRIRVLIADDNRSVRRGLRIQLESAPDIRVIGEVSNGADAVVAARNENADVVLMDLQMPALTGAEATRELMRDPGAGRVAVIVMTSFAIDEYVFEALDAGAVGYLLKGHDSADVVEAVRTAARGGAAVSAHVASGVLREFARRGARDAELELDVPLTAAEKRIVAALASGVTSNLALAQELHLSAHTVRSQLHSALKKTGSTDRTQLALWGARTAARLHSNE